MNVEPTRTCVGCRNRKPRARLLRFVRDEVTGALVFDPRGTLPGRGAYACPQEQCLELALKKGGFARGFRAALRGATRDDLRALVAEVQRALGEALRQRKRKGASARLGEHLARLGVKARDEVRPRAVED